MPLTVTAVPERVAADRLEGAADRLEGAADRLEGAADWPEDAADGVEGAAARLEVALVRLDPDLPVPAYAHDGDAGADLCTRVDVVLEPGERALVPTGVALALPVGYAGFVHARSGLAARHGLAVVNAPGVIDAGYRGEVQVALVNLDPREPVRLSRGDRVAQLVVQRVEQVRFTETGRLPGSARGADGYGSTGGFGPRPAVQEG